MANITYFSGLWQSLVSAGEGQAPISPLIFIGVVLAISLSAFFMLIGAWIQYQKGLGIIGKIERDFLLLTDDSVSPRRAKLTGGLRPYIAEVLQAAKSGLSPVSEVVSRVSVKESARFSSAFSRFSVGGVLILGLAGTFSAFAELIDDSGLAQGETSAKGIAYVVAHLNMAFWASITGVGASVVLHALSSILTTPARQRFLARLEESGFLVCARHQVTESVPAEAAKADQLPEDVSVENQEGELLAKISEELSKCTEAMSTAATRLESASLTTPEGIAQILKDLREELTKSEARHESLLAIGQECKTALAGVAEEAKATLKEQVETFASKQVQVFSQAQGISREVLTHIEKSDAERLTAFTEGVKELVLGISKVMDNWNGTFATMVTAVESDRKAFLELSKENWTEAAAKIREQMDAANERSALVVDQVRNVCNGVAGEAVSRLEAAYQTQIGDWSVQISLANKQRETAENLLKTVDERLAVLAVNSDKILKGSDLALQQLQLSAKEFGKVPGDFSKSVGILDTEIKVVRSGAEELGRVVGQLPGDVAKVFVGVDRRLEMVSRQLTKIIEIGEKSGYSARESWWRSSWEKIIKLGGKRPKP